MRAATLGLAGLVLTSCRASELPIPVGNAPGTGAEQGGPGVPGVGGGEPPANGGGGAGGAACPPPDDTSGGASGSLGGAAGQAVVGSPGGASGTGAGGSGQAGAAAGGSTGGALGGRGGAPATMGGTGGSAATGTGGAMSSTGGTAAQTGGSDGASGGQTGTGGSGPGDQNGSGGAAGQGPSGSTGGAAGEGGPSGGGSGSGGTAGATGSGGAGGETATQVTSADAAGTAMTVRLDGALADPAADFNVPLGSNGRSCVTCHAAEQSMSLTPAGAQARFDATDGTDPLFRPVDGAVSPLADVSTTDARRTAYALLLSKGLIRVGLPIPANADFDLITVSDPYGYASSAELSLFRRPLPAANLSFLSTVMWDGREGLITADDPQGGLQRALASQAGHAVLGHGQAAAPLDPTRVLGIVAFELGIVSAQSTSLTAGPLDAFGALGGPVALARQPFYPGINDPNLMDPAKPFDPAVFTIYNTWQATDPQGADADARRQIALGQQIFDTRSFSMTGVAGLTTSDVPTVTVTCSTCHDAPGAGSNSSSRFFDLGLASSSRAGTELPVYTLQERSTGTQIVVSDPGRALITGAFKDVATFKVPTLRGLAARAPYFHNGSAATLSNVVGFYNGRFNIGLTSDEKAALTAFLSSL